MLLLLEDLLDFVCLVMAADREFGLDRLSVILLLEDCEEPTPQALF